MSDAAIGWGCELHLKVGSGTLTEIGEMIALEPGGVQAETVEVTHFKSPGKMREYKKGLRNPGSGSFQVNWKPGGPTDDLINAAVAEPGPCEYKIVYPDEDGEPLEQETGEVLVLSRTPAVPMGQQMTCTVNLQFSGERTQAAAA